MVQVGDEVEVMVLEIDGERQQGREPALWAQAHVIFSLEGTIDPDKAVRAVQLSIDKYCSVSKTLEAAGATITWDVRVNGQTASRNPSA